VPAQELARLIDGEHDHPRLDGRASGVEALPGLVGMEQGVGDDVLAILRGDEVTEPALKGDLQQVGIRVEVLQGDGVARGEQALESGGIFCF
jgi:hypothetical protein